MLQLIDMMWTEFWTAHSTAYEYAVQDELVSILVGNLP